MKSKLQKAVDVIYKKCHGKIRGTFHVIYNISFTKVNFIC